MTARRHSRRRFGLFGLVAVTATACIALSSAYSVSAGSTTTTINGIEVIVPETGSVRENALQHQHTDHHLLKPRNNNNNNNPTPASNYVYSPETDCYGALLPVGEFTYTKNSPDPFLQPRKPYQCPEGTFCLVDVRDNWRPYSDNFMNRGRCQAYSTEGQSCIPAYEGAYFHPIQEDGKYFLRGSYCDPSSLLCTGDNIHALPPTCVQRRPQNICYTNQIDGWNNTAFDPTNVAELPGSGMWCPSANGRAPNRTELEFAARYFVSQNGENNFPNTVQMLEMVPVPNGAGYSNFYGASLERNWRVGNELLIKVWPYPVCYEPDGSCKGPKCSKTDCTQFPLGALPAPYLAGHMNYIYLWALLHTLAHNAPEIPTPSQLNAIDGLAFLLKETHACVFCRWNYGQLIDIYGPPSSGYSVRDAGTRAGIAKWFWRAHNNANEHTRLTHRTSNALACAPDEEFCKGWDVCQNAGNPEGLMCNSAGKATVFQNPGYTSPWFMGWEDAEEIWRIK